MIGAVASEICILHAIWLKILVKSGFIGVKLLNQTIDVQSKTNFGEYRIIKVYDPEYQRLKTLNETDSRKSYF